MLGRVLSLVAALLLSCASTSAHAYARPLHSENARQGFATTAHDVHRERAHVTADAASENSPASVEPSDGRRFYAKARYYSGGRGSFLSVDPWSGDQSNPLSYNKYLYAYANPGSYLDPDGRAGFLTDLRDRFDRTDAILREQAVNSEGTAGLLGYSLARGLAAAGSAIPRALNLASDGIAQALPGETFSGVRADGAAEFGNAVDAGVYVASNPGQVARDIHGNAVQTTVALAEGDRGASSDAISFFGQLGSGAAVGRKFVAATAAGEGRLPLTSVEGPDGGPAGQFFDPAMIDELDEAYPAVARGIDPDYGSGKGRRGTPETREHIDIERDRFLEANPEYEHVGGGTNRLTGEQVPEEYLPGPGGGRRGSSYADLTFEAPDGSRLRINTVDTDEMGVMTPREQRNFDRIFEQTGEPIIGLPKPESVQRRRP